MSWWDDDDEDIDEIQHAIEVIESREWTIVDLMIRILRKETKIMASLQEVKDAIGQSDQAVEDAANRVIATVGELTAQVQALQDQIAAGTGVTAEDLQALVDKAAEITGEAEAIDPSAPTA